MLECDFCKEKILEEEDLGKIIGTTVYCKSCLAFEKMTEEAYALFLKSVSIMQKIPIMPDYHLSWEEKIAEWLEEEHDKEILRISRSY